MINNDNNPPADDKRGLEFLMPSKNNKVVAEEKQALNTQSIDALDRTGGKDYIRVSFIMDVEDEEFYKNFIYHKNRISPDPYGHREAQREIMEMLKKTYPDVAPRPEKQRIAEQKYRGGKKK